MAEMEWVCINCTWSWCCARSDEFQACNVALVALQIKGTALLVGWGWAAITAVDTEPPTAWEDTVSTGSLLNVLGGDRRAGLWAGRGERGTVVF